MLGPARIELALVARDKARFFALNQAHDPDGMYSRTWEQVVERYAKEGIKPLGGPDAESKAHGPALRGWYERVYRAACEPAHMADLLEFMPDPSVLDMRAGEVKTGLLHAVVAVDQGLHVMFGTAKFVSDNELGLSFDTSSFEARVTKLRAVEAR